MDDICYSQACFGKQGASAGLEARLYGRQDACRYKANRKTPCVSRMDHGKL